MAFKRKELVVNLKCSMGALHCLFMAHKITGTFSLAFEKGKIGKVQNYIGTKKKIRLKIIVTSIPFKWTHVSLCLIFTNYFDSWENYRPSRKRLHN